MENETTAPAEDTTPKTPLLRKALLIGGAVTGLIIAGVFVFSKDEPTDGEVIEIEPTKDDVETPESSPTE